MRPLLPVPPASRRRVARQLQGRRSRGLIHSLAHVAQSHLFGVRPSARAAIQLPGEAGRCRVGFSRASARADSRRALACRDCTVGARRRTPRRRAAPRYAATARHLRRVKRQSSPLERRAAVRGGWLLPDPAGFGAASRSEVARSRRSSFLVKGPSCGAATRCAARGRGSYPTSKSSSSGSSTARRRRPRSRSSRCSTPGARR